MNRAEFLRVTDINNDTLKSFVRRGQLPFTKYEDGKYSTEDALRMVMFTELVDRCRIGCDLAARIMTMLPRLNVYFASMVEWGEQIAAGAIWVDGGALPRCGSLSDLVADVARFNASHVVMINVTECVHILQSRGVVFVTDTIERVGQVPAQLQGANQ